MLPKQADHVFVTVPKLIGQAPSSDGASAGLDVSGRPSHNLTAEIELVPRQPCLEKVFDEIEASRPTYSG